MELPKRKNIRLEGYDYYQSGFYFITICTKNREQILSRIVPIVGDAAYGVPSPMAGNIHDVPIVKLSETGQMVNQYILNINCVYENVSIDKYIIMPNHIHLIVMINRKEASLSAGGTPWAAPPTGTSIPIIVNSLKTLTSKKFGETLWQRSYYDHIIKNEQEYTKIWEYIDTNPAKWQEDKYYIS